MIDAALQNDSYLFTVEVPGIIGASIIDESHFFTIAIQYEKSRSSRVAQWF
jgi:hypothetical protein